jgi:hypothetical protein
MPTHAGEGDRHLSPSEVKEASSFPVLVWGSDELRRAAMRRRNPLPGTP